MKTKLSLLFIAAGLIFLASCSKYPPGVDRVQEDLVVYTQIDIQKDFNQFQTFSIVDSIAYIDNRDSGHYLTPEVQAILDRIVMNMENRGFIKVSKDQNPNLGFTVSVVKTTNTTVWYPGWWWGYPGYYPPYYWGWDDYWWYYPYYPTYITSYSSGTLIIDLADFVNITEDKQIPIAWFCYVRALLTGTHSLEQIEASIDQAFNQSPDLKTNAN